MKSCNSVGLFFAIVWVIATTVVVVECRPNYLRRIDRTEAIEYTTSGNDTRRHQRWNALWELATMVRCTTGKGIVSAIYDYAWYGCYCGFGGEGEPVDGTDRCCMIHDNCYDVAFHTHECPVEPQVYFVPYRGHYTMHNCRTNRSRITCDPPQTYPWWHLYPECAAAICHCDAAVSMCLGRNHFDPGHAWYPKYTCEVGPPMTISPTVAMGTDDTTISPSVPSTSVSTIDERFSTDSSVRSEELADIRGSPDQGSNEGAIHSSIDNAIGDEGLTFDAERRRQKMARHKNKHGKYV